MPEWELYKTVRIEGEVKFAGIYTIKKGETLSSVLTRTGGFTGKADPYAAVFNRVNAREVQRKQLKEARVSGETAPLLFTALNSPYWFGSLGEPTPNLTVTIFNYAMSPYPDWQQKAGTRGPAGKFCWTAAISWTPLTTSWNCGARSA